MEFRLAVMAGSIVELKSKLQGYLSGGSGEFYQGEIKREKETFALFAGDEELQEAVATGAGRRRWSASLRGPWGGRRGASAPRMCSTSCSRASASVSECFT